MGGTESGRLVGRCPGFLANCESNLDACRNFHFRLVRQTGLDERELGAAVAAVVAGSKKHKRAGTNDRNCRVWQLFRAPERLWHCVRASAPIPSLVSFPHTARARARRFRTHQSSAVVRTILYDYLVDCILRAREMKGARHRLFGSGCSVTGGKVRGLRSCGRRLRAACAELGKCKFTRQHCWGLYLTCFKYFWEPPGRAGKCQEGGQ